MTRIADWNNKKVLEIIRWLSDEAVKNESFNYTHNHNFGILLVEIQEKIENFKGE